MKLLLDQGLPRSAAALLCQAGVDTVHAGDIGHSSDNDAALLQLGRDTGRVIVTLDADFHTLLALSGAASPSVIRIRISGLRGQEVTNLLQTVVTQCAAELTQGAAVAVQEGRIRIRTLPIVR